VASAAAIAVASTTVETAVVETSASLSTEDEDHLSPGYLALTELLGLSAFSAGPPRSRV
jgi:hypothetical protein